MEHESLIRLSVFAGLFCLLALAEWARPRRRLRVSKPRRWFTNWALVLIDNASLRLLSLVLPFLAVGAALTAADSGWGLFNWLDLPWLLELIAAMLLLDLAIWAQHLITHKIPILWRLHRVHHADRDFDVTTALRFHPVEILLSMLWKVSLVYAIGPSALAVILFEITLNGTAMFNHANLALPKSLDRVIRTILVTPDMHRIHHSTNRVEHDSNYGFALSIWDRLFRTYRAQPNDGHDKMEIGLQWQGDEPNRLTWSLALPFFKK